MLIMQKKYLIIIMTLRIVFVSKEDNVNIVI